MKPGMPWRRVFAATVGLIWLFTAAIARCDLTIMQEVEGYKDEKLAQKEQLMVMVSGKRLRMDIGQMMTSIVLSDRKATYSILHEARQYVILPHDQAAGKGPAPAMGDVDKMWEGAKVEPTGTTEQISGFTCRQVLVRAKSGAVTELWLSDDALKIERYFAEFQNFSEIGANPILDEVQKRPDLHGYPIRIVQYENNQMTNRSTVRRLDTNKIPDSEFEIPAGYEEIKPDEASTKPSPATKPAEKRKTP
jgi:outer membrane lipoprotein-sorting protein